MFERFHPRNASRPPAWRWERARLAASGEWPLARGRDDDWVCRAAGFIRAYGEGNATPHALAAVEGRWPDLYWAHHYWRQAELAGGDAGRREAAARFGLEARVLAGCDDDEIRGETGMYVEDVRAYTALFFDVRGRLPERQYIHLQVIGPSAQRGLSSREYDVLWKLFGYELGPRLLDQLMYTFDGPRRKVAADGVADALAKSCRDDITRQAAIVGKTWRNDQISQGVILQVWNEAKKIEQAGGGIGAASDALVANLAAAMSAIPFVVGKATARNATLAALDRTGLEPSGRELVEYSMSEGPDPDPERLALEFPTPGRG